MSSNFAPFLWIFAFEKMRLGVLFKKIGYWPHLYESSCIRWAKQYVKHSKDIKETCNVIVISITVIWGKNDVLKL